MSVTCGINLPGMCRPYRALRKTAVFPGVHTPGYFMAPLRGFGGGAGPTSGSDGKVYTLRSVQTVTYVPG